MPTTDDDDKAARIFCDETIERLATIAKFSADADLEIFARFIRNAAFFYFQDARLSSPSKLKKEIVALHRAAEKREYDRVSALLQELSPIARMTIEQRAQFRKIQLPACDDLRNADRRDAACDIVAALVRLGGHWRTRPSGKRSPTWQPALLAPKSPRNFPKRDLERVFMKRLRVAWREATNEEPARTANRDKPGPFVKLTEECLRLIDAGYVDTVNLINSTDR